LTALFNAIVLNRVLLQILVMTYKYSWQNWSWRKSPNNREIRIIKVCVYRRMAFFFLLCHSWFLWWLPLFSTFWSHLWTGFSLWLIFEKWRNEVLRRVIFFWAGWSKSACIQDDLLFSSCIVRDRLLVVLIVDLVRTRHDLLSSNTD